MRRLPSPASSAAKPAAAKAAAAKPAAKAPVKAPVKAPAKAPAKAPVSSSQACRQTCGQACREEASRRQTGHASTCCCSQADNACTCCASRRTGNTCQRRNANQRFLSLVDGKSTAMRSTCSASRFFLRPLRQARAATPLHSSPHLPANPRSVPQASSSDPARPPVPAP